MSLLSLAERIDDAVVASERPRPMGPQFEGVLVAAQAGADWAWTLLYRSVSRALLGYLRGQGAADPEDLLGDVFVQIARNISTFEGDEAAFRSWAFLVAHHRVLDDRRRRRRRPSTPVAQLPETPGGSSEDEAMDRLRASEVMDMLSVLTPEQRDVVLLRVFGELSVAEVGAVVDRPVSAVKALQRRAYARLRKEISDEQYPNAPLRR